MCSLCKRCTNENDRRWYAKNAENAREYCRKYDAANREKNREHSRWYDATYPEKVRESVRKYYDNPSNREKERESCRQWAKNNPERVLEYAHRYDARKRSAYVAPVNHREIYERDDWICQLCLQPVDQTLKYPHPMSKSLDHVKPLSKGGTHEPSNVQLAHFVCNCRKKNKTQW